MNGINKVSEFRGNGQTENAQKRKKEPVQEEARLEQEDEKRSATQQKTDKERLTAQQNTEKQAVWGKAKEHTATGNSIIDQLQAQADSIREAFDPKRKKNLYDATMDLMLVEQIEEIPGLRAIHTKLLFQIRSVKASGAKPGAIRVAVNKLMKVIGKVKSKIKNLQKEEHLEDKRQRAEKEKRKSKEEALRRELELRKKIRKAKERNDVEESKMGLGANYGGPYEEFSPEMAAAAYSSTGDPVLDMDMGTDTGMVIDMAVADVGVAADAAALDICV